MVTATKELQKCLCGSNQPTKHAFQLENFHLCVLVCLFKAARAIFQLSGGYQYYR
jgi:hypothetical protein